MKRVMQCVHYIQPGELAMNIDIYLYIYVDHQLKYLFKYFPLYFPLI